MKLKVLFVALHSERILLVTGSRVYFPESLGKLWSVFEMNSAATLGEVICVLCSGVVMVFQMKSAATLGEVIYALGLFLCFR